MQISRWLSVSEIKLKLETIQNTKTNTDHQMTLSTSYLYYTGLAERQN